MTAPDVRTKYERNLRKFVTDHANKPLTLVASKGSGNRLVLWGEHQSPVASSVKPTVIFSMHIRQHIDFWKTVNHLRGVLDGLTRPIPEAVSASAIIAENIISGPSPILSDTTDWCALPVYDGGLTRGFAFTSTGCMWVAPNGELISFDMERKWASGVSMSTPVQPSLPVSQHATPAASVGAQASMKALAEKGKTAALTPRVTAADVERVQGIAGTRQILDAEERALRKREKHAKKAPKRKGEFKTPTYKREPMSDKYGELMRKVKAEAGL